MLREEDIAIELRCQQFHCKCYMRDLNGEWSVLLFESKQETNKVSCPHCQSKVYLDGYGSVTLKDMPVWYGMAQELTFVCHRYECRHCGKKFTEEVPLRHAGTKVTDRAARWIQAMLRFKVSIRSIQGTNAVAQTLALRCPVPLEHVAVEDEFGEVGPQDYLQKRFGLTADHIIHKARKVLSRKR